MFAFGFILSVDWGFSRARSLDPGFWHPIVAALAMGSSKDKKSKSDKSTGVPSTGSVVSGSATSSANPLENALDSSVDKMKVSWCELVGE